MAVEVMDAQGKSVIDQTGELVCTQAFPSMPVRFWNDPDGALYHQAYFDTFPNIWCHGDFAKITPHQGVIIDGRSDATLNPNGVRIGTADIYQQLDQYHDIQEALAVSYLEHEQESIWLFLQMKPGCELSDTLINTIKADIKQQLSPHHVPKRITQAPDLPRTFNGKIVELVVKRILHHQPVNHTTALANPGSLSFFTQLVGHRIPPATRE